MMRALRVVSCHAANLDGSIERIVAYLRATLGQPVEFVNDIAWPERYALLDAGEIDVAWICGAPYVQRMTATPGKIELLAAPVWRGTRYAGRPVYFSDLVVRADSPFHRFADLRGARWVYNEPASLSGFVAMQSYLAGKGENDAYFGVVCASGGHLRSLAMLLSGQADVTGIDSVVLAEHLRTQPEIAAQIRILDSVGPLPSMPWVASAHLPTPRRVAISQALVQMSQAAAGRAVLQTTPLSAFAPVVDCDYDPIRAMFTGQNSGG